MLDSLQMIYDRLLDSTSMQHHRFLFEKFNLSNRLTGLLGPRGVGKTTLLLQTIKKHFSPNLFYFSADHIYFKSKSIYEFVEELYLKQNMTTFFIDEIHKYPNWSQELKNLYDGFPDIKIVFSGSSSLDLIKGHYDLSRRARLYYLPGLSFREYLNFHHDQQIASHPFDQLMHGDTTLRRVIAKIPGGLGLYHQYLKDGFYPFLKEDSLSYYEKILSVINKTIYEDIANFYNLKTGNLIYLSKILNFLATIPPGKITNHNLAKNLSIDDKTVSGYLTMLSETGLIEMIYSAAPGNQGMRKPEKIFLNNTNLCYALVEQSKISHEIGTIRELAFIQATKNAGLSVGHSNKGDYQIEKFIFEIGGKNKTRTQIQGMENAFLVKDDVLSSMQSMIPLIYFGFLY